MTNTLRIDEQTQQQPARTSGVTELVLTSNAPEHAALLFPMIAHLSKKCQDRWITWIAPQNVTRQLLESYGVDTHLIRLIHTNKDQSALWITWEALAAGNSHTVIASPGRLTDKELIQLETAAMRGNCQGLLLRVR